VIIGPSVLAWVKVDQPVAVMALLGLAFLLFLAGLEVDLRAMTPQSAARSAHRLRRPPDALGVLPRQLSSGEGIPVHVIERGDH
jgi:hypothetical protein